MVGEIRDRRDLGAFIPSYLDDYPLDPEEFRLYAHICRRQGKDGCFASVPNMAKHCRIDKHKAQKALQVLVESGLIEPEVRPGKTTIYSLPHADEWVTPDEVRIIQSRIYAKKRATQVEKHRPNPGGKPPTPQVENHLPTQVENHLPTQVENHLPTQVENHLLRESNLRESNLRESHQGTHTKDAHEREKENEAIAVEVLEDPEVVVKPSSTPIDSFEPCQEKHIDPEDQKAPAPCDNKGQRHRLRYDPKRMQELQDKINLGELSYLPPNELKGLADFVMGDIVSLYRQSGVILWTDTQRSRDINQGFLEFLVKAESHYIKNAEHARALIKNYEEKPEDWDQLISKVEKWQQFLQNPGEAIGDAVNRMGSKQASDLDRELSQKAIAVAFQQQRQQQPVTPENMDAKTRERWEAYQNLLKIQEATKVSATPSRPA